MFTAEWIGPFKPILTLLILPPASLLLLAPAGLVLLWRRHRRSGAALVLASAVLLGALSCQGVAEGLARHLITEPPPVQPAQLRAAGVQAIVVLGGGLREHAPEFGQPQLGRSSLGRLMYGAHLARETGLPLAFSGGLGWGSGAHQSVSEAQAARLFTERWLAANGITLRWVDERSRDTRENALESFRLMAPHGVRRIALVSNAWHLQRAQRLFEQAGFEVVPAPTLPVATDDAPSFRWLPTSRGLHQSATVLREWLGQRLAT